MTIFTTIVLSFVIISAMIAAMAIGVMAGREPIKGSCGGVNGGPCELCSGRCRKAANKEGR